MFNGRYLTVTLPGSLLRHTDSRGLCVGQAVVASLHLVTFAMSSTILCDQTAEYYHNPIQID